jgi:hypothetical protein
MYFYYQQLSMLFDKIQWQTFEKMKNLFFKNQFSRMEKLNVIFPQVKLQWGSKFVTDNTIGHMIR